MKLDALAVIAANGCFLVAGAGVARAMGLWSAPRELPRCIAVAYMVGVAVVGLSWSALLLAGAPLRASTVAISCAALAAVGLRRPDRAPLLRRSRSVSPGARWFVIATASLVVLALASFVALHHVQPIASFDGWAKWTMKARALVSLDGIDSRVFTGAAYRPLEPDYPLLFPSLQAADFRFIGWPNTEVIFLQSWLLLVGFVGALAQLLRGRVTPIAVWPSLLLVALAPELASQVRGVLADAPLAFFLALAALAAWLYVDSGDARWLLPALVFAAAAAATKDEGTPFVIVLGLVVWLFAWRRGRPLRPLAGASLAIVLIALPWRVWTATRGIGTALPLASNLDPAHLASRASRVAPALGSLAARSLDPRLFLAAVPLTLAAVAIAWRRRRGRELAGFVLLLLALVYAPIVWAYWASPSDLAWALRSSAARVVTTPAVLSLAFLPVLVETLAAAPRSHVESFGATLLQHTRRPMQGERPDEPQDEVPAFGEEHSEGLVQHPGRSPAAAAARDPSGHGGADRAG